MFSDENTSLGGGGYTKENQKRTKKRWQVTDYGHPKTEKGEKSNWNTAQGKTRKVLEKKTKQKPQVYQTSSTFG